MSSYQLSISVKYSKPLIWRKVKLNDGISFRQLHEVILALFGWKDTQPYRFQLAHQQITNQYGQDTSLFLSEYITKQPVFHYLYGTSEEEWSLTIQATPMYDFDPLHNEIRLLDHAENHPPFGVGGILPYQKMRKEIQNPDSTHFHTIHRMLEHPHPPFDAAAIQQTLNAILMKNTSYPTENLHKIVTKVRKELEKHMDIHSLLLIKDDHATYPCYIEELDNGIEVLIFYDENGFCRSILNSVNGEPDLLFTSSLTVDFLFDLVEESDLLLFDQQNLCFKNQPGCLPTVPKVLDMDTMIMVLQKLLYVLQTLEELPSLSQQRMLLLDRNDNLEEQCFLMKEEVCSLQFTEQEIEELLTLPHTNERMRLNLLVLPNKGFMDSKKMDIHMIATGYEYTKEEEIQLGSTEVLIDQLYFYFQALFHERGLPECIHTNNINLANMLKEVGAALSIEILTAAPQPTDSDDLLDIILSSLQLSEVDLQALDLVESDIHTEMLMQKIEKTDVTAVPKILN